LLEGQDVAANDAVHGQHPPSEPRGLRIVVVEDGRNIADSTAELLRTDGHRVQAAPDILSALRVATQAEPPEVVIVDTDSSGVDGCELAQELRRLPVFRRPLVIAVASPEERLDRCRSLEAGIHLHLQKPIDRHFLSRVLKRFQSVISPTDDLARAPHSITP
jgi:CheY-like chemotaxis protein